MDVELIHEPHNWGRAPSRIVCAANRHEGTIIPSARHHDKLMNRLISSWGWPNLVWEQGFIDQYGTFFTRTEAWKIAFDNNQIIRRVGGDTNDGGTLYSENLY